MGRWGKIGTTFAMAGLLLGAGPNTWAHAEGTFGFYGDIGLIDMPTARMPSDGLLSTSVATFDGTARTTLSFQIFPRLSGSFRYTTIDNYTSDGGRTYDRSFDIKYQLLTETERRPSVTVGLRDFIGTGLLTSEYIVATKSLSPKLTFSAGLGWGRLGSFKGFTNPLGVIDESFETRPSRDFGLGGEVESDQWFRGDAAAFGGIEYRFNDKWTAKLEYSSDAYVREVGNGTFERTTPLNFGVVYTGFRGVELAAYAMHGTLIGVSASFLIDPKTPAAGPGRDPAPLPVKPRSAASTSWQPTAEASAAVIARLSKLLEQEGQVVESYQLSGSEARVAVRNNSFRTTAQAVGRTARAMSHAMPASVETFVIVPVSLGQPLAEIRIKRDDLERLENTPGAIEDSFDLAQISDATRESGEVLVDDLYPKLSYGLSPGLSLSFFDPTRPVEINAALVANARWSIAPGLSIGGEMRQTVLTNSNPRDERTDPSELPRVRTNSDQYDRERTPYLRNLTLEYLFRPTETTFARVTSGYLERAYAGVSTEVLWKPVDQKLALGAELNYVVQRDFDDLFSLQDYDTLTGHVSAYYPLGENFHAQVDVGRYLAGDYGATFTLDREFKNGWRVGAFATFTDASAEAFGEGSFDKGIQITGPLDWVLGRPNPNTFTARVKSLNRDGGARVVVQNRLYGIVRDSHSRDLEANWGRFWK